ncbi:protein mono-ADP-ribosyltransferase PARP10 [Numenius arquata]|uniref:protein mono-ADP-ribosyltransferase PARP10 n=1 Tax=Numenius arquata TaxID=31919 RepID=UPI003D307257
MAGPPPEPVPQPGTGVTGHGATSSPCQRRDGPVTAPRWPVTAPPGRDSPLSATDSPPGVCGQMEEGVLEVGGAPPDTPEELLVLYFESRRRSRGGPVRSCQRLGTLFFLTFENPQDAERVLTQPLHHLGGAMLQVRPAPPWDPHRLLLGGLDPRTPPEELEPALGALLGRPPGTFGVSRGPAPGWGLLQLRDPITPQELASAGARGEGLGVSLLRAPRVPGVLVRAAAPVLSPDLLELYFENRRSGGGRVRGARVLPGGTAAIVTFQEHAVAERVLQRPHRLRDMELHLAPHYPFLGVLEGGETPPPDEMPPQGETPLPGTATPLETPRPGMAPPLEVTPPPDTAPAPPRDMAPSPDVPPPAPTTPLPVEPPAAFPGGDGDTAPAGRWQEAGGPSPPWGAQEEVLVPAEPGALRFLQRHHQDLLGSIPPEVSLLPLEGGDVAGFRVRGEPGRCRGAAEFLQSLLGSVGAQGVTLQFPGVARFLRDQGGQSLIQRLESRFQCVIDLDGVHWEPPDPQLELMELLPPSCCRDPPTRDLPEDAEGDDGDGLRSNIEEIKELMAALRPDRGDPPPPPGDPSSQPPSGHREEEEEEEEEEARMLLAIQRSMENRGREEEELAKAVALSLQQQQQREEEEEDEEEDAGLLAAMAASLEEALPAADTARVTVFSSSSSSSSPGEVARALQRALGGLQRAQAVRGEGLRALPARCRPWLALLQRRHAVRLHLRPDAAVLRGFAPYTPPAARDLRRLLRRLNPPGGPLRWDPPEAAARPEGSRRRRDAGTLHCQRAREEFDGGSPLSPSPPPARSPPLGESPRCRGHRGARPDAPRHRLTTTVPQCRSYRAMAPRDRDGAMDEDEEDDEDEVRLLPLPEDSEEFRDAVTRFYQTLEELHGKIGIVKVEKLVHPLLYQQYQLKKGSVARGCPPGVPPERWLFHGTTPAASRQICRHGFDRSFCGRNAALYGLGVYFSAQARLSAQDRYSPPGPQGHKFIFLATVLTGAFALGGRGLRAPPLREEGAGPPRRYDSLVDNPRNPNIFVIFNDTQAYPQYLITCCRRGGAPETPPPGPT